ncbi:PREDICTED: upstream activation factor subunit spp27-like [Lupinus angustifolius]|uniref:upstream activation factor subunit spp27-like n=1 Tax=Lupinus angustifolius TaxID=3871 RepID=UPI00092E2B3F|nr:PREDICTED: upstream activation factor subunit spp27-like [Lupinus angustifolius]
MVSESELIGRLREFLRSSDLNTTTTTTVRRQLESDFGIDLSDRKAFIREQVDLFLQTEHQQQQEEEEEEGEEAFKSEQSQGSNSKVEENDDDDDDDEEDKPNHSRNGKKKKKKNKERSNKLGDEVVKKRSGGFCKLCSLSPQLQELMGAPEMARTEVVKQLWAYIREKDLQDPENRRNIICDEPLRAIFGVKSINMFQMNKALSKHIWPLDSDDVVQVKAEPKEKQKKQEREEDSDEPKRKEKRQKGGKSGFLAPLKLSDALANFLGTGESELTRAEVIKKMWDYIKGNNLQDPSDKRKILCDEKLKELFDVDTFNGFTVTKLLAPHFIKTS